MEATRSVLVSFPSASPSASARGISGIFVSEKWVLTHGTALLSSALVDGWMDGWNSRPGGLIRVPKRLREKLKFRIVRERSGSADASERLLEDSARAAFLWLCPLIAETLDDALKFWQFDGINESTRAFLPVFLLLKLDLDDDLDDGSELSRAEDVLNGLYEGAPSSLRRGSLLELRSTPLGNRLFLDSAARGVIGNLIGRDDCVLLTDASTLPGCEGAPVYTLGPRALCGMTIAPLSRCKGERLPYTLVANLRPCLRRLLRRSCPRDNGLLPAFHYNTPALFSPPINILERSVAWVRCGANWGTAILIDEKSGTFVTCSHVVSMAERYDIKIGQRRRDDASTSAVWAARLVYRTTPTDEPYDVAVLRVKPSELDRSLRALKLADRIPPKGEAAISIGFSLSWSLRPTIGGGVVSKSLPCMLQTSCCVVGGSSGGPIVGSAGAGEYEIIGMVVCNAILPDGSVYPRFSMAVPAAVLKGPLEEYTRTQDPKVLRVLRSRDAAVRKIWKLQPAVFPSKM